MHSNLRKDNDNDIKVTYKYPQGICHRGKDCFFIHELDPMSEKNPIEHKKMLKKLLSPNKTKLKSSQNVQVQLKKPAKPQQTDKFMLPSQNKALQGKNGNKKYNRYSDFDPNAGSNQNQNQNPNQNQAPQPQQPPNPYAIPMQIPMQQAMYAPNPYLAPMQMQMQMPIQMAIPITMVNLPVSPTNNATVSNDPASLNANAVEFVPNFGAPQVQIQPQFIVPVQVQSPIANMNVNGIQSPMANMNINPNVNGNINPSTPMKSPSAGYNPYLIAGAGNAPNINGNTYGLNGNSNQMQDQSPCKFNAEDELINNPDAFNEDDYEVFEDENGEIIVVEKDQLYGSDPEYHDQKMLREYNKQRAMNNGNTYSQRGIRAGGQTYVYGANPNNKDYDEHKNIHSYDNDNGSGSPSNRRKKKKTRRGGKGRNKNKNKANGNGSGYASAAAKFGNMYPTKGKVESFDADQHSNPDYDPNAKICRFWLSARCAYGENCKMAHRFETNSCPHCDKHVGKSPLMQQQVK